jgi:hypothetical protein
MEKNVKAYQLVEVLISTPVPSMKAYRPVAASSPAAAPPIRVLRFAFGPTIVRVFSLWPTLWLLPSK